MKYIYSIAFALFVSTAVFAQAEGDKPAPTQSLDVKPDYPGGINAFYQYISNNFRTPEVDKDMVAKILMGFVVEKDGSITDIKILKDPGYGMGAEAARVLKACPKKWIPGTQNGKLVRASYTLPITLKIKAETTQEKQGETKE